MLIGEHVYPNEEDLFAQVSEGDRWQPVPLLESLKARARAAELWNLFLPESQYGAGLTNLEYAPLCEIMGRSPWAPEVFNCSAPDTGNMEVLVRYGTVEQRERWGGSKVRIVSLRRRDRCRGRMAPGLAGLRVGAFWEPGDPALISLPGPAWLGAS